MNLIEQLNRARHFAGLKELTNEQSVELAEKKLSGKEKEEFLTKMSGKMDKEKKKSMTPDESMDAGSIKPKKKKKVSEEIDEILTDAGAPVLSAEQVSKLEQLEEGRGGGKQKAALRTKNYLAVRKEIDDHFSEHGWPMSMLGTPQEIMRVGDEVHTKGSTDLGVISSIDGRKITVKFAAGEQTLDAVKLFPKFMQHA